MKRAIVLTLTSLGLASGLPVSPAHAELVPRGAELTVNSYTSSIQGNPAVASAPDGAFVVVWQGASALDTKGIQGQRFASDGTRLASELQVNAYTSRSQEDPAVASGPSGDFVVVWTDARLAGQIEGIWGRRFSSQGTPLGGDFEVDPGRRADVAVGPGGDFVVVWGLRDASVSPAAADVMARRFGSDGLPLGTSTVVNGYTTFYQDLARVAALPDGGFVAAWAGVSEQSPPAPPSILGIELRRFSSDGVPVGGDVQVSEDPTRDHGRPALAAAPGGEVVLAWRVDADGTDEIRARRYLSDGSASGDAFLVGLGDQPDVALEDTGALVVVWTRDEDPGDALREIRGRRFAPDASPLGGEFAVNGYTPGDQYSPSVSAAAAGDVVVVWHDGAFLVDGQDGDWAGVQGRRFRPGTPIFADGFDVDGTAPWSVVVGEP